MCLVLILDIWGICQQNSIFLFSYFSSPSYPGGNVQCSSNRPSFNLNLRTIQSRLTRSTKWSQRKWLTRLFHKLYKVIPTEMTNKVIFQYLGKFKCDKAFIWSTLMEPFWVVLYTLSFQMKRDLWRPYTSFITGRPHVTETTRTSVVWMYNHVINAGMMPLVLDITKYLNIDTKKQGVV